MDPAQETGTTFRKIKKKTKEKSQAAAASEAQLWHGKRQGPAARPMDRSLQHMLTVNTEAVEATVLVVIAGLRLGQSALITVSSTCRPPAAKHLGLHTSVGAAQSCCSPRLVGSPVVCQHERPSWQFHHFCRGSHPALQAPLQGQQPLHGPCAVVTIGKKPTLVSG